MSAAPHTLPPNARVLLVRLSALGDIIFALETLSTLKAARPDLRIDFLTEDRFAKILTGHPMIEALIQAPRRSVLGIPRYLRRLRRDRYDLVLDLHGILKSALPVLCARSKHKVGFASPGSREGAAFAYHQRVRLPQPIPHRAECGLHLLRALGITAPAAPASLPVDPSIPDVFPTETGPRVLLHPGTSAFAAFKRWPAARFAKLANDLLDRGHDVAVSYGPGERALFDAIQSTAPRVREVDGASRGLPGLIHTLREAQVVVAADTGPLHMAAAVGTPVVALFGPKDTNRYGPRGEQHALLFHPVPCRPCRRRSCASPQCVLGIEVASVVAAVLARTESA